MKKLLFLLICVANFSMAGIIPNFHTVDKGNLYRSAQLSKKQFIRYIKKYDIKTVINLRGESSKDWYKDEMEAMLETSTGHFDIGMSAKRLPHRKDLLKLLDLLENAPRPILIHCQGGADRTGEASALYKLVEEFKTKKEALKMLRLKYFHLRKRYPAKRYFISEVFQDPQWARDHYFPCEGKYKYYEPSKYSECN